MVVAQLPKRCGTRNKGTSVDKESTQSICCRWSRVVKSIPTHFTVGKVNIRLPMDGTQNLWDTRTWEKKEVDTLGGTQKIALRRGVAHGKFFKSCDSCESFLEEELGDCDCRLLRQTSRDQGRVKILCMWVLFDQRGGIWVMSLEERMSAWERKEPELSVQLLPTASKLHKCLIRTREVAW